jgi:hypothetical protein
MHIIDPIDTLVVDDLTDLVDAVDTLRFVRIDVDADAPDPDATSVYDLSPVPATYVGIQRASADRRRLIRSARQDIKGLRAAFDAGWDVGPELSHEEQRLSMLIAADHGGRS